MDFDSLLSGCDFLDGGNLLTDKSVQERIIKIDMIRSGLVIDLDGFHNVLVLGNCLDFHGDPGKPMRTPTEDASYLGEGYFFLPLVEECMSYAETCEFFRAFNMDYNSAFVYDGMDVFEYIENFPERLLDIGGYDICEADELYFIRYELIEQLEEFILEKWDSAKELVEFSSYTLIRAAERLDNNTLQVLEVGH